MEFLKEEKSKRDIPVELLKLALKRAGQIGNLMNSGAKEEIEDIVKESARRIAAHESYILETKKEIKKIKEQISEILDSVQLYIGESGLGGEDNPGVRGAGTILPFRYRRSDHSEKDGDSPQEKITCLAEARVTATGQPLPLDFSLEKEVDAKAGPAVEKEINRVMHNYLVGKIAGEDLLDSSGQLIIKKGAAITPETVGRAESEGKMADLIIHVVLPGVED
ncbi:MAG: hypothetical protein ACOY4I_00890 [Bacillota bacterium]